MEILKSFKLPFLLRSFFAGVFFVLSYSIAANTAVIDSNNLFFVGLPFALISGVVVYGIHRSLLYPFFEWGFNASWTKWLRGKWLPLISRNAIKNLVGRWDSKAKVNELSSNRSDQMTVWADYIHLQFTSSWCIWLGYFFGKEVNNYLDCPCQYVWSWLGLGLLKDLFYYSSNNPLCPLAVFFLFVALISNWRARSVEEHWND
jgi:hypothetical protein